MAEVSQASRVVVLLDGDGAIFTPQLIALGQSGGHKAASQLSNSIKDHIRSLDEIRQFQLSVYIFLNKRGLTDTFSRCGYHAAKARLEDFITGFNQATERFMMVDVGSGKEAADSKIKGMAFRSTQRIVLTDDIPYQLSWRTRFDFPKRTRSYLEVT